MPQTLPTESPPAHELTTAPSEIRDPDYWERLIDERKAGAFLGLGDRAMQAMRQRGGGPRFHRLSSRCIRYSRRDLKSWAESRLRSSTSDDGAAA